MKASWNSSAYAATSNVYRSQTVAQTFAQKSVHPDLDPAKMKNGRRESRNSATCPAATPIAIFVDLTGSMQELSKTIITGLGTIMDRLLASKPVSDPQVLVGGTGDAYYDRGPLQISQFESDNRIAAFVEKIWIEQGGGGNGGESYLLAWYFASRHVDSDAATEGRKGYLFTIGDENPHLDLTRDQVQVIFGPNVRPESDLTAAGLLQECRRHWHVFHLIVKDKSVLPRWQQLLGEATLWVDDHTKLAEVIASTIQIVEGQDAAAVAASWDGSTALTVASATRGLVAHSKTGPAGLVVTS